VKPANNAAVRNAFWPTPSVHNTAGNASTAGTKRQSFAPGTRRIQYERDQRGDLEQCVGDEVGQQRQRRAQQQEHRRVEEILAARSGCGVLFGQEMRRRVVGERRRAGQRQLSRGTEADEIAR
jgi:hypothetical protein